MKKSATFLVIGLFFFALIYFVSGFVQKLINKNEITESISKLPTFSFTTLKNATFSSRDIKEGPVLIVRFHPECEHCQYEISEIIKSRICDKKIKILLISSADRFKVYNFLQQFNISEYKEIIPLLDTAFMFVHIFGKDIVPSNYIYDKKLELVKVLYGEYKTESILKYFEECE